ncbi:galanin receptor 2b-like [Anabrus simplex]|uniref:galanin receptor 2b-like n=1 Tax=Anabrus simplex TaxID=316456 RepID=UPI0035A31314
MEKNLSRTRDESYCAVVGTFSSVTNYFLVNLSVADLLVTLICMPMAVGVAVTRLWLYGQFMCKITFYLQGVSVGASVFTITAMSIDRCLAIRHPMAFRKIFSRTTTLIVIALLWIVSIVIFLPLLWVRTLEVVEFQGYEYPYCYEQWVDSNRTIYDTVCFVVVYAVPGSVVIMCYSMMGRRLCAISPPFDGDSVDSMASTKQGRSLVRERRRVARILLLLAILFAMCWLPYNVMALVLEYYSDGENKGDLTILNFSLLLGHANSAINPIIYCFMTRTFRSTVRELLMRSRTSLAARPHQRYKIRAPLRRSATSSSGYDSYQSPHRRCYMLSTIRRGSHTPGHPHHTSQSTRTHMATTNFNFTDTNNRYL